LPDNLRKFLRTVLTRQDLVAHGWVSHYTVRRDPI